MENIDPRSKSSLAEMSRIGNDNDNSDDSDEGTTATPYVLHDSFCFARRLSLHRASDFMLIW